MRLEVCVFGFGMLNSLKYANYVVFLYMLEYQRVTHLAFRKFKKGATKP